MRTILWSLLAFTALCAAFLSIGCLLINVLIARMMAKTGQFHGMIFTPRQIRVQSIEFLSLAVFSSWLAYKAVKRLLMLDPPDIAHNRR